MLKSLFILTLTTATMAAGTAAADVYKYKDEKGNIQFTDKPPQLPAERLNVKSQRTDVVSVQERTSAEQKQRAANADQQQQARAQAADQQEAAQLSAKDKAERCAKARERYDKYMNSQRLYEQGADGERRYLSSEELDAARASAKTSMDVLCQ
jgi:LmbE family N-acetylglucosaminyl deacetylase